MKNPNALLLGIVCAGVLASCTNSSKPVKMPVSGSLPSKDPVSNRLYDEVNSYRRSRGASELQRHAGLDRLAQDHCEYLRRNRGTFTVYGKNVSHDGFEGRTLIARERFHMHTIGENVVAANPSGSNPAPTLVSLWKQSNSHHKNMIDQWTVTGIGVVRDSDGMIFATQLFGTMNYSQMASRERFNQF